MIHYHYYCVIPHLCCRSQKHLISSNFILNANSLINCITKWTVGFISYDGQQFDIYMKDDKSSDGHSLFKLLFSPKQYNNLAILRKQQKKMASQECLRSKEIFQYSINTLLANLLGLSCFNLLRGNFIKHQAQYKWSKPLHILLLLSTGINLCVSGYYGYSYLNMASRQMQQILKLAEDPRIYLDVDKIEINEEMDIKQPNRILVKQGSIRQKFANKQ